MNALGPPDCHAECAETLRSLAAHNDLEITVATAPPLVRGPYTTESFRCPHGVLWWIEPTGEQIATWVREGVE